MSESGHDKTMTRKKKLPSFDKWRKSTLDSVVQVGKNFTKPTEDWAPVLLLMSPKKGFLITPLAEVFQDRDSKCQLPAVLVSLFRKAKPKLAALVMSAWYSAIQPDHPLAQLTLELSSVFGASTDPNRKEIVLVEIASKAGHDEMWSAEIIRSPIAPPVLGAWMQWPEPAGGRFGCILKHTFEKAGLP